jgi:hypothetical protein
MAEPHHRPVDTSTAEFIPPPATKGPDHSPRGDLSEFERAQLRQVTAQAGALAADVVQWHRESGAVIDGNLERNLCLGLGVAALGALIMQILAWTRLLAPQELPPATLRTAREIIEGQDPVAEPAVLDGRAVALLRRAQAIKAKARSISRHW